MENHRIQVRHGLQEVRLRLHRILQLLHRREKVRVGHEEVLLQKALLQSQAASAAILTQTAS